MLEDRNATAQSDKAVKAAIACAIAAYLDLEQQPAVTQTAAWATAQRAEARKLSSAWPARGMTWAEAGRPR
jgi:hypothetical protein